MQQVTTALLVKCPGDCQAGCHPPSQSSGMQSHLLGRGIRYNPPPPPPQKPKQTNLNTWAEYQQSLSTEPLQNSPAPWVLSQNSTELQKTQQMRFLSTGISHLHSDFARTAVPCRYRCNYNFHSHWSLIETQITLEHLGTALLTDSPITLTPPTPSSVCY